VPSLVTVASGVPASIGGAHMFMRVGAAAQLTGRPPLPWPLLLRLLLLRSPQQHAQQQCQHSRLAHMCM
jgi:hypothetical protein